MIYSSKEREEEVWQWLASQHGLDRRSEVLRHVVGRAYRNGFQHAVDEVVQRTTHKIYLRDAL